MGSIACTSLLFFLRVRAVYRRAIYVTVIFGTLGLVTVAVNIFESTTRHMGQSRHDSYSSLLLLTSFAILEIGRIPQTKYCNHNTITHYTLPISTSLNDTLIFLAISYRLAADVVAVEKSWRVRLFLITRGKGLYHLSRSLMQSGFTYYL